MFTEVSRRNGFVFSGTGAETIVALLDCGSLAKLLEVGDMGVAAENIFIHRSMCDTKMALTLHENISLCHFLAATRVHDQPQSSEELSTRDCVLLQKIRREET